MVALLEEIEVLKRENEELRLRLQERERVDALRRALRGCETVDDVAERGVAFANAELDRVPCALLLDDPVRSAFTIQAAAGLPNELNGAGSLSVERDGSLYERLLSERLLVHSEETPLESMKPLAKAMGDGRLTIAGLHDSGELVGLLVVGGKLDAVQRLEEASAELSSAIAATLRARSRAEELAMLEVQERELVGLLREVEERDATTREDLERAREFQQLMMSLPNVKGLKLDGLYEPMGLVGGDIYAVSELEDRLRIFIADATGHGVRASLTTMFIKSGYESLKRAADPAALLQALNESIAGTYRSSEMLFSASCVDVYPKEGRIVLACAGHPPACVVRGNAFSLLEGKGALMGVRAGMRYENVHTTLGPGEGIYLFTDGIADARTPSGDFFGEDRLYAMIRDAHVAGESPAAKIREAVTSFVGTRGLADDVSLVGVRIETTN